MKFRLFLLLAVLTTAAHAKFAGPQLAPVATLERNAAAYSKEHPDDANGWYVLARIHYLAFANKSYALAISYGKAGSAQEAPQLYRAYQAKAEWTVEEEAKRRALEKSGLPVMPADAEGRAKVEAETARQIEILKQEKWAPPVVTAAEGAKHVREAFAAFAKAQAIEPNNALYQLGVAWLQQQVAEEKAAFEKAGVTDLPAPLAEKERAESFYKAFSLAREKDAASKSAPLLISSWVSNEAGEQYLKMLPQGPAAKEIEEHLAKLRSLPRGPITPIVFPMRPGITSISSLLDPAKKVGFDLAGFGEAASWTWLKVDTSLLVWDPAQSGVIRDGRQLFGTYTWGIFWEDGFHALAMLDDNHDGLLTGHELTGLAAWTDKNQDGVSTADEVVTLEKLRVLSVATSAPNKEGIHPHHPEGLRLENGDAFPVWDWITE